VSSAWVPSPIGVTTPILLGHIDTGLGFSGTVDYHVPSDGLSRALTGIDCAISFPGGFCTCHYALSTGETVVFESKTLDPLDPNAFFLAHWTGRIPLINGIDLEVKSISALPSVHELVVWGEQWIGE
jgi:hypothetical protein